MNTAYHQLKAAADFGRATFLAGDKCVPAFDARLMAMLTGRDIGVTPKGEASSVAVMKAWSTAWHKENLRRVKVRNRQDYAKRITTT